MTKRNDAPVATMGLPERESMRTRLESILRGPGASCEMSAGDGAHTLDLVLDEMMKPMSMADFKILTVGNLAIANDCISETVFQAMIRAIKEGK